MNYSGIKRALKKRSFIESFFVPTMEAKEADSGGIPESASEINCLSSL